ncbi:glycosyhydrolase [Thiocystis violascens]|uniref:Glycosyl hydrolase family 57 n=1 Tax=Thiocystis violascens (strain ATCC 17096 / DSM 198 / 6111) TaxID=765911 RepID=I3YEW0_THIV6|nr:glycosyhydrolase [Thiocystis violascens]AFL75528.1 Glycosyl hydrolase family 57 [Thiocystis violascens DSM 198]
MLILVILVILVASIWAGLLLAYRIPLQRLWREPALAVPVLIVESDDWGPGPPAHAAALGRIVDILARHRDATGRAAVMTIGAILAIPDNEAIRRNGLRWHDSRTLLAPDFDAIRKALIQGQELGVLALQLHGMTHYWPPTFLKAMADDKLVRDWILTSDGVETETLPSPIQSRWTDTSVLPSQPLSVETIRAAVAEEVSRFQDCFGVRPTVAVPPTFVWNRDVEQAWVEHGIQVIVTPGRRLTLRDAEGRPGGCDRTMLNAERGASGAIYLVRDIYFEPALGHRVEPTLAEIARHVRLGRPALIETHRVNFTGTQEQRERSLAELDRLLSRARERWPDMRFLSSAELAERLAQRDPSMVEQRLSLRLSIWIGRAAAIDRLRKLAWITGLAIPAWLFQVARRFSGKT